MERNPTLCAALPLGQTQATYGAVRDSTLEADLLWKSVVARAGRETPTRLHGVGDGAPWIAEQFALRFAA